MIESGDHRPLQSKRKAITAFLPYVVWQERNGQHEMPNRFLHAARASKMERFVWRRVGNHVSTLLSRASTHTALLASPHVLWGWLARDDVLLGWFGRGKDLVQQWAAATSAVPYTEEVAQSVVDTLLQIASERELLPHIPFHIWSRLVEQPALPPICLGRSVGTHIHVVKAVRKLEDIEILTSYFLLVWSEWGALSELPWNGGFSEMCTSIREDLGGIEMGRHRACLIRRLNHILGQLDLGLEYLEQKNPSLSEYDLKDMKWQYGKLREVLLEVERRTSSQTVTLFCVLTPVEIHRISRNVCVCSPTPVSIVS